MGDILIVPSNTLAPQPDRIPFINWVNNSTSNWKVVSGATVNLSAPAQTNTVSIQPSNAIISVVSLNVRNNFTINGVQVIDGTANWIGPDTGIAGPTGAQGAVGFQGATGSLLSFTITVGNKNSSVVSAAYAASKALVALVARGPTLCAKQS